MRYLSLCSGIEAATVAWHSLGWTPVAFAEIEAVPAVRWIGRRIEQVLNNRTQPPPTTANSPQG